MHPTLVLLPGMDGTGDLFEPLLAAIGDVFPTLILRYPTAVQLDYQALAELVRQSLPDDRPYIILAESFSGPIAIKLGAQSPRGMLGLILCASFVSSPRPELARFVGLLRAIPIRLAADLMGPRMLMGRFQTPVLRRLFREALAKVSPPVLRARARAASLVDVSSEFKATQLPALYLQASEDNVIPKSAAERFARLAVRGRVVTVAGPHFLLQCASAESARAIREFIDTVRADSICT
jgi:pimeloyl-ACP methyl ester carboxylesterase